MQKYSSYIIVGVIIMALLATFIIQKNKVINAPHADSITPVLVSCENYNNEQSTCEKNGCTYFDYCNKCATTASSDTQVCSLPALPQSPNQIKEIEPNNTTEDADKNNHFVAGILVQGMIDAASDSEDIFKIQVANQQKAKIYLDRIPSNADFDLFLYDENKHTIKESRLKHSSREFIETPLANGTYYIRVKAYQASQSIPYSLLWQFE